MDVFVLDIDTDASYSQLLRQEDSTVVASDDVACLWGVSRDGTPVTIVVDPRTYFSCFYFPAPDRYNGHAFTAEVR